MPSVAENLEVFNGWYDWAHAGDEWSEQFGGTEALWWFVLYPRIHRYLPASKILEIAPGYGRWTQFLKNQCQSMIAVDISEKCIQRCKHRFANDKRIDFLVNDGRSLSLVQDGSIDFVFSFDSLVHAEKDVIESYLIQLAEKLKPDGVGFIHHSNLGSYRRRLAIMSAYRRLPTTFRKRVLSERDMEKLLSINFEAWRAESMSGDLFCQYCKHAGLRCVSQELIDWGKGQCLIDAISVFARPGSRWDRENAYLENGRFMESGRITASLARLYCR